MRGVLEERAHLRKPVLADDGKTVSVSVDYPKRLAEIWKRERTKLCIFPHGVVEIAFAVDAAGISKKAISCTTVCASITNNPLLRTSLANAEVHTLGDFKDSDPEQAEVHLAHLVSDCKVRHARQISASIGAYTPTPPPTPQLHRPPYVGAQRPVVHTAILVGARLRNEPRVLPRAHHL